MTKPIKMRNRRLNFGASVIENRWIVDDTSCLDLTSRESNLLHDACCHTHDKMRENIQKEENRRRKEREMESIKRRYPELFP